MSMQHTIFAAACKANEICLDGLPQTRANESYIGTIIQIVIAVVAVLSVLFIAIGGMRYVLSQGDPQGVSKAKHTIVYALIGLVVAIAAQAVVIVVINGVS